MLCRNFQNNISKYNNSFAVAFLGANIRPPPGQGPPCFRISGQLFHRSGCLHPADNVAPTFNQLYIIDVADAVNFRLNNPANDGCLQEIFQIISNVMQRISPCSMAYKSMRQIEIEEQQRADQENRAPSVVTMKFIAGQDRRRYNQPMSNEEACIFVGEDGAPPVIFTSRVRVYK